MWPFKKHNFKLQYDVEITYFATVPLPELLVGDEVEIVVVIVVPLPPEELADNFELTKEIATDPYSVP